MNFEDIAKILGKAGKVVIVENGKPTYVVVPFEEYANASKQEERDNPFPQLTEDNGNGGDEDEEELTIDDLPV